MTSDRNGLIGLRTIEADLIILNLLLNVVKLHKVT